ncbi:MAG: sulfite exporter TauE/SafE family protein [Bacilli bacterium]|jgi:uncharacterized membrane protein YfcA|nr:sulfite exporter TauE/SafE family protein [Bacilli bacterium]
MVEQILFLLVIFFANIIQALTGFAGTVLAMPFSILLVGTETSKAVLNLIAIPVSIYIAIRERKSIKWKEGLIMFLLIGAGFGIGFGLEFLPLDASILLKVYGSIIIAVALAFLFLIHPDTMKIPDWILYILLVLGGILHKLFVSGGPLVVIYAMAKFKDKNEFRATLSVIWIILNSIMFGQHIYLGYFTSQVWILFAIGFGLTIGSIFIGKFLVDKVSLPVFMKITYVLLLISGATLLF